MHSRKGHPTNLCLRPNAMLGFIQKALHAIYREFADKLRSVFSAARVDEATLHELEKVLLSADTGVQTTRTIIENLKAGILAGRITQGSQLKMALAQELKKLLITHPFKQPADVYLLVGINGSGKTTFAAKLGAWLKGKGKKVLFVAGDTFRAAATEQLSAWGQKLGIPVVMGKENQDPASVIFQGCERFREEGFDTLVIDTAGRLQTKLNLMKELEKIKKTIMKRLPEKKIATLLTVDAMLGQNSLEQAKIFHESTPLDGIVLTKMDGTAKGGIVFSITEQLKVPIAFISFGEKPEQLKIFNADEFIDDLLGD